MTQLYTISTFSTLLLSIFFLIFRSRNKDIKWRVLFFYLICSLIFDILLRIPTIITQRFYLFSFFTLIEFCLITYFVYVGYKVKAFKWFVSCAVIVFFFVFLYSILNNYNIEFDYLSASIAGLLVIISCILFIYEQINGPEVNIFYSSKTFWIIIGFLIYMSATFFIFMSAGPLKLTLDQRLMLWVFNIVPNMIKNLLFGIAFYKPMVSPIDFSTGRQADKPER